MPDVLEKLVRHERLSLQAKLGPTPERTIGLPQRLTHNLMRTRPKSSLTTL